MSIIRQADFIREASSTAGTGNITLVGITGWARFSQAFPAGTVVPYIIEAGTNRETGIGTVLAGNILERTKVTSTLASGVFNNTNPIALSLSGTVYVSCGPTASSVTVSEAIVTNAANTYVVPLGVGTIIQTTTASVYTLPSVSIIDRKIHIINQFAGAITSSAANVIPLNGTAATTSILPATVGKYATLQSNGTNWNIILAN